MVDFWKGEALLLDAGSGSSRKVPPPITTTTLPSGKKLIEATSEMERVGKYFHPFSQICLPRAANTPIHIGLRSDGHWDEHIQTATAMTTSGMSGMALNHSDIGGYVSILILSPVQISHFTRSNLNY